MGLIDAVLGAQNPFSQFVGDNRNTIRGAFAGFGSGNSISDGLMRANNAARSGSIADDEARLLRDEQAKQADQLNQTTEWLKTRGYEDLLPLVSAGQGNLALTEALKRMQPGYGAVEAPRPIEVNGQLVDPITGAVIGDYRDPNAAQGAAPSGYQWVQGTNGPQQTYIPGGPADPSTQAKTTEAQRRNQQLASVIQPELQSVEQNWSELASGGNQAASSLPFGTGIGLTSPGYQQASNSLATIAQSYLYSVSGAAATDAEVRKIVDSVTPKPFESQESINAKLARVRQMADAVIQAGGGAAPAPTQGNRTSTGLTWSIEP